MNLTALDLVHLTKLTSHYVDNVTCLECCKYYVAPETAACGHTLCHTCWRGQRSCPCCAAPLDKRSLKLNLPMQTRTEHIHTLVEALEKLFDIKLDEFVLDIPDTDVRSLNDPTKNVKDWLASSQNHFSAPLLNSEPCTQDDLIPVQISTSKIQIHSNSKKSKTPEKVVYVQQPQDDWDKIEEMPDVDRNSTNKENVAAMNKQPLLNYLVEDNEYSSDNPRRSSRKKELNLSEPTITMRGQYTSLEKSSSKNLSSETEKKSNKAKQNWNNVKRMRKEFSKLNKQNRNKLNVSIEMCKKTQSTISKPNADLEQPKPPEVESPQLIYTIEDNTPTIQEKSKAKDNAFALDTNNVERNHSLENLSSDLHEICYENDVLKKTVPEEVTNKSLTSEQCVKLDQDNKYTNVPCTKSKEQDFPESKKENVDNKTTKMPFIKKGELCPRQDESVNLQTINIDSNNKQDTSEDIEISIKIGNTFTKIVIKKKSNDVQLKVNTDQEVQTSNCLINNNIVASGSQNKPQEILINIANDKTVLATTPQSKSTKINTGPGNTLQKSSSTKKNTASAETATAQFEITESVEKELSNIMECEEIGNHESIASDNKLSTPKNCTQKSVINKKDLIQSNNNKNVALSENKLTNDVDIFDNVSNQEQNLHFLMNSNHAPSEILMPTARSKKFQNHPDKRGREINDEDEIPSPKKFKSMFSKTKSNKIASSGILQQSNKNNVVPENDSMNYDVVMDQVFASIDADIVESQKVLTKKDTNKSLVTQSKCAEDYFESQKKQDRNITSTQIASSNKKLSRKECDNEKYSENLFSIIEKETDSHDNKAVKEDGSTQHYIDNLLTPGMCRNLASTHDDEIPDNLEMGIKEICTPYQDHDDSDKSVVEETPQKEISIAKQKTINEISVHHLQKSNSVASKSAGNTQATKSIINVSHLIVESNKTGKDVTIVDAATNKQALETPLTINRFVDQIKHKSTPVARKSLNFECENIEDDDPEQTLCSSSVVAKTTQEKEFMCKAFEQTPKSPVKKTLITKNIKMTNLKYCIAGSCLSASELNNVKMICRKYNWKYVDKYTKEVTHLVVGVDDENRSQRSVKYMCALAASKWIVSYEWVETCVNTNLVVGESHYEVLDGTGEPGPKRSRLAKNKLFQGITFFCMPPFSVLDADVLKEMLEASGGRVVNEAKAVKATGDAPAFLLAEPEHTQEDQFVYLALELGIVPVNYEWVLNCLGSYSLSSIHELLLCPSSLLPQQTANWPAILISRDSE